MRLAAALAACLLALVAGAGLGLLREKSPSFRLARGGSDDAIWRINQETGQVSVCGAALTGHALSEMETRLAAQIRAAGRDAAKRRLLLPEIDELDDLSRPRCSPWSASRNPVELEIGGVSDFS